MKKLTNKICLTVLVIMLIVVSCVFTTFSYSKFIINNNYNSNANIATPLFFVSNLSSEPTNYVLQLENTNPDMTKQTYSFIVSNFSNESVSHIPMEYTISLFNSGILPLSISLIRNSVSLGSLNINNNSFTCSPQFIDCNQAITHSYQIEVEWIDTFNSVDYSGKVDSLQILINWSQII